jgi:hypothetical protein
MACCGDRMVGSIVPLLVTCMRHVWCVDVMCCVVYRWNGDSRKSRRVELLRYEIVLDLYMFYSCSIAIV